ncbi:bifunctional ADP-dependent NAD(P)H-hydrate dehydratase/NAD(P)H-hydrate epimerase [Baaleninema simplex]|uniref:bifunctional ADP-dependent NAD(P)H-hydrate dehydratase/NAD(P)H-hydrate epimerase n=1 Tax=Baaleninema simplex TaxID=2862350 RepID=UPI000347D200|nr:bifunctional ADP-dependent NAD(P)H-hydrate dehydratase/NAD(P)H-hydrate epimerase [Baaleninema simplex]
MTPFPLPLDTTDRVIVTAEQMAAIESRLFEAGMPVAALMEKAASRIASRLVAILERDFPQITPHVGVLVGPGHNGGDALVIARELHFRGFPVSVYRPLGDKAKSLTSQQAQYVRSLGVSFVESVESLQTCDLFADGLFGFGQTRPIEGDLAEVVNWINQQPQPVASIDVPSGLHTDTGEILGTALKAKYTFCLGLWKLGFFQDAALDVIGNAELVEFDIPLADVIAVLGETPSLQRITPQTALAAFPIPRNRATHKYKQGHLLLVCGSRQYSGAAILAGLGARASGVGMVSIAVPETVKPLVHAQLPEVLVLGCPETKEGAIARFPEGFDLDRYDAIACGPGLTPHTEGIVRTVLESTTPVILDADGLNVLSGLPKWGEGRPSSELTNANPLILTPHPGEFRRLFPHLQHSHPVLAARTAADRSRAIVVMKGARAAIAYPDGFANVNPDSTPALARGGTGDVLTGLMGGLVAIAIAWKVPVEPLVSAAVWWHARAGKRAAMERSELGVDAFTLAQYLTDLRSREQGTDNGQQ